MWVPKLLLTPIKNRIFGPKTAKFGPKLVSLVKYWPFARHLFTLLYHRLLQRYPKKSFQEKGPLSNSRWCWVFVFPVERESFPEVRIRIETGIGLLSRDMPLAVEPPLLRFGAPSIHLDFYWKLFSGHPVPVNENLRQLEKGTRATYRRCAADHCLCFVAFFNGTRSCFSHPRTVYWTSRYLSLLFYNLVVLHLLKGKYSIQWKTLLLFCSVVLTSVTVFKKIKKMIGNHILCCLPQYTFNNARDKGRKGLRA